MYILALDASTYTGTVALLSDGVLLDVRETAMRGRDEERLMPAVVNLLSAHGVSPGELGGVACGAGPGSFTSLRIAASIAKGIASARTIPLHVAPSPCLIVAGAEPALGPGRYLALLDAMRGDVFALRVDVEPDGRLMPQGTTVLDQRSNVEARWSGEDVTLVGPDEAVNVRPHARGFATLLRQGLARAVPLATWEPDYGRKAEAQVKWERAHGRELEAR